MTSKKLSIYLSDLERLTGKFNREKARGEINYLLGVLDRYIKHFSDDKVIWLFKRYLKIRNRETHDLEVLIFQEIIINYINNY